MTNNVFQISIENWEELDLILTDLDDFISEEIGKSSSQDRQLHLAGIKDKVEDAKKLLDDFQEFEDSRELTSEINSLEAQVEDMEQEIVYIKEQTYDLHGLINSFYISFFGGSNGKTNN